jgi:Protein of unknown function (DUF3303)
VCAELLELLRAGEGAVGTFAPKLLAFPPGDCADAGTASTAATATADSIVSGKRPAASGCREEGGKPVVLQNADRTGRGRMPRLLYMVVERFTQGPGPVYERAAEHGRLLPDGLVYVDSWVDKRLDRCFQLMETDEPRLFDEWTARWSDVAEFEVVPVIGSAEASKLVLG